MPINDQKPFEIVQTDLGQVAFAWRFADGIIQWGHEAAAIVGLETADLPATAQDLKKLINPQDLPNLMSALQASAAKLDESGNTASGLRISEPFRLSTREGTQRHMRLEARMVLDAQTNSPLLRGFLVRDTNVSQENQVPGILAGRTATAEAIDRILLVRSAGVNNKGYFMALGLDRVGLLNAAHGAQFVDTVLLEVERRLSVFFEGSAIVGRMAGDIYGIVFEDLPHTQADVLATALLQLFTTTPMMTLHGPIMIGLSIGGAALSASGETGSDVIARAEAALTEAKLKGRGCFIVSSSLNEKRERARKLLQGGHGVYRALEEGRMRMAFQPVMDMNTRKIDFYESLIRMIDEDGKLVPADFFIPALEELGMVRLLDIFSLHTAIRELANYPDLSLSVNVSHQSLIDPGWLRAAVSLLMGRRDVASRLIVEITESSAMTNLQWALRVVSTLKDLGCRIALDDFGAGSTSFIQLKTLMVDVVKIDKAYIRGIQDPVNRLFVKSMIDLAQGIGVCTVAEGAETLEEAEMLYEEGVSHVQGYAIGFPSIERVWLPKNHDQRIQKSA